MTREELKAHCLRQVEGCEMWAKCKGEEPHGRIYEEHKLILELLEQETVSKEVYDHEYFLRKEFELKIDELQRQLEEQAVKAESILDKIRAEIIMYEGDCRLSVDEYPSCKQCTDNVFETIYRIFDKYRGESED